ncbi:MAG: hypothetical protein JWP75_92 [Frondihabitans sp.]|nr:hypothetical protein [Frondihabitans sp.]
MNGYILYRGPSGDVLRIDSDGSNRKALVRELEGLVPNEVDTLGIVLIPSVKTRLRLVENAA